MDNVSIKAVSDNKIVRANIELMSVRNDCWWTNKFDCISNNLTACTLEGESVYDEMGNIHRFINPQKYKTRSLDLKFVSFLKPITMHEATHRGIFNKDNMYYLDFGD